MNNGIISGETANYSAIGMVGISITNDESTTADVPMNVLHLVHNDIPIKRNLYSIQQCETKNMMSTTVREKLGHGISVWMKRFQNILNKIRSNINIQNNKDRNNIKRTRATI